ncbi:TVP38/TMEM64 family protein [Marinobacter sp. JSM 1782161]|uniref:TVP38/TMEM64 family protein n=1 Tax=Marinobacter sp. JSM 1782161 TaxID=2685906 RepID=UPI001403B947|nr:TVP38/TMEM64 family protein [Marinobacter sp. JSM 1782161]
MEQTELDRRAGWLRSPVMGIVASILSVTIILAVLYAFGIHHQVVDLLRWFDAQGAWAPLLFILIMVLVMVLLLPGVLFTTGAGFVFGVVEGTLYVVIGTVLGGSLAFFIARHFFGEKARRYVMARSHLQLMSEEMTPHDWKIVLLTRLIPFFPSKISNFFFGLTNFSFRGFFVGSLIGYIPFSLHNVYLGSIAADLTTLGVRESARSPLEWTIYGAGFVGTVVAVIFLNRLARRALARYTRKEDIVEDST